MDYPDMTERRADGKVILELRGEVSELKANMNHVKEGIDKLNTKFDMVVDREIDHNLEIQLLNSNLEQLVDDVKSNAQIINNHIKDDAPIHSWLNNKVASGVFFVVSLVITAFIMQIIIPKLFGTN